jgi:signal transduction histidine kinase/ligand-binding sensor domain-containing protein
MLDRYFRIISILAMLAWCCRPAAVYAQSQILRDMDHKSWTPTNGAPIAINHLAQDSDGSLWIGSAPPIGLCNFDGEAFRPFRSPPGEPHLPSTYVTSLIVTKAGTLWVAFRRAGVARVARGHVTLYHSADANQIETVRHLREAPDGIVWALDNRKGLIRFGSDGKWHIEATPSSSPISAMFIDSSNTLWLAQDGYLHRRRLPETTYVRTGVRANVVTGIVESSNREIWMIDHDEANSSGRLQQIDLAGNLISVRPEGLSGSGAMLAMPNGSLVIASFITGLRQMSAAELLAPSKARDDSASDTLGPAGGLSSQWPRSLLLDAHGNIWIGAQFGLDRLRPRQLPLSIASQPGATWGMCSTARGDTLISNTLGELYSVVQGKPMRLPYGIPAATRSFACTAIDRFWFVDRRGDIWSSDGGREMALPTIEGMRQWEFVKLVVASDHTLYVSVIGTADYEGSVWRYKENRWTQLQHGGVPDTGGHAYVDRQDRLWIGTPDGRVILHDKNVSRMFSSGDPGLGIVHIFAETSHGFLAAGTNGLAFLRDSAFEMLRYAEPSLVRGVRGIVESRNGDVWLNSANGFAQITAEEIRAAIADPAHMMKVRIVRDGDFIPYNGAHTVRNNFWDSVARDSQGDLWFSVIGARSALVRLDPRDTSTAHHAPRVKISSIDIDGQPLGSAGSVEPSARTIRFHYFGVNLTSPESVIYRYRLDGLDDLWQDAGQRTEARYTTLPPGTYTFRVIASSSDGLWTEPVSSASFTVLPKFHQTWWFMSAMLALLVLGAAIIYRIRVQQISRVMRLRFDERLAERTRVARELHDTLLQTIHGSKLVADRALRDTTDTNNLVRALEQLSLWLSEASAEGRAALRSLRASATERNDLAAALRRALDECHGSDAHTEVSFSVHGSAKEMHPVVRDEVYRIGYEAIRNACMHSRANRIEVRLEYGSDLKLLLRDNGVGIEAAVLEGGRDGHFGLRGMQERAERIRAKLTFVSALGEGTAITLTVPGHVVFRSI